MPIHSASSRAAIACVPKRLRPLLVTGVALAAGAAVASPAYATTCAVGTFLAPQGVCQVTYTSTGTTAFTAPAGVTAVDVLVVGGGGGGANIQGSSGGGAGGQVKWLIGRAVTPSTSYAVTVGSGGWSTDGGSFSNGGTGGDSVFDSGASEVRATGGQGGQGSSGGSSAANSGWVSPPSPVPGGTGNGSGSGGGGGGGAGTAAAGGTGTAGAPGAGGAGVDVTSVFPALTPAAYGGGGGGASSCGISNCGWAGGVGGSGGGGSGANGWPFDSRTPPVANTGGGGGGHSELWGGGTNGGILGSYGAAGRVVVRYVPLAPPDAPIIAVATGGNGQAEVTVHVGSGSGGAPDSFEVTASPAPASGAGTCTITLPATACTIAGLNNGIAYTFTATATNAAGTSGPSVASTSVTPAGPPEPPANVAATAGNGSATITWAVPAFDGGTPITGYTVTASPGGGTCTTTGALTCSITGLANGTAYTFSATATNAAGTSGPSTASTSVTPAAPPVPDESGGTTPSATPGRLSATKGSVRVPVKTSGAGTAVLVGYRVAGPGTGAKLACTSKARFAKAGAKVLICVPTTAAQRLRLAGAVRMRVVLVFTAKGAKAQRTVVGVATMPQITAPRPAVAG